MGKGQGGHEGAAPSCVTASAPGKALVAGGYLVLERPNVGLVLAAGGGGGSRFYATAMARTVTDEGVGAGDCADRDVVGGGDDADGVDVSSDDDVVEKGCGNHSVRLDVHSPQFGTVWRYWLVYRGGGGEGGVVDVDDDAPTVRLRPRGGGDRGGGGGGNPFVERTLLLTLLYIRTVLGPGEFHRRVSEELRLAAAEAAREEEERGDVDASSEKQSPPKSRRRRHVSVALAIKLRADNDFYSQIRRMRGMGLDLTPGNASSLPPFLPASYCDGDVDGADGGDGEVHKTGMGSSAALVTSLVGCLLLYFGVVRLPPQARGPRQRRRPSAGGGDEAEGGEGGARGEAAAASVAHYADGVRVAHNLAQICHCHAQGKIGSGFDVSSASHGSHAYTRFSPRIVSSLLEGGVGGGDTEDGACTVDAEALRRIVNDEDPDGRVWDCAVEPLELPPGVELLMADVCGGSETPSMARKILAWKRGEEERSGPGGGGGGGPPPPVWRDLEETNAAIRRSLLRLGDLREPLAMFGPTILSGMTARRWEELAAEDDERRSGTVVPDGDAKTDEASAAVAEVARELVSLRRHFVDARRLLKTMGELAGVPVEPDEQTRLADATMDVPGVIAAGVPGAGGFDALFVLYVVGRDTGDGAAEVVGSVSDEVRDRVGQVWRRWSDAAGGSTGDSTVTGATKSVDGLLCPLAVRSSGYGLTNGLCEGKLAW